MNYRKIIHSTEPPFLSIITRCYKRPVGLSRNQESIAALLDRNFEQIFIEDEVGEGLLRANTAFGDPETRELVVGKYVWLLDDDDFATNPGMITELKTISELYGSPDVIFFRMNIIGGPNGDLYPTPETWHMRPKIAHIGGSCFVVKREIYEKFIHEFAKPRCGDFAYIDAICRSGASVYFHDKLMCETGQIGRGRPE